MKKKVKLLIGMFLINAMAFAQQVKQPSSSSVKTAIESEASVWVGIINTVIGIVIFGGMISVIHGVISKKEMSKAFIGAWVLALIVWTLGNVILIG